MIKDLLVFLGLAFILFVNDIKTNPCIIKKKYKSNQIYIILYLHHVMSLFVKFGFLVSNRSLLLLYLLSPILTIIHWQTNKNKCFVSEMVSHLCGEETEFKDIMSIFNIKKDRNYYLLFVIGWIIGFMRFKRIIKI